MPLHIVRDDIVNMKVDVIVAAGSAAPGTPRPTGGVNGRIRQMAGARLLEALRRLGGIRTAGATLTEAYDLPCKYVIHTAGPVWRGGSCGEETLLRACYREALSLAARKGLESIAFPLISTGKYGYPKAEAMQAATAVIREFLTEHDMEVYLVVYDREAFQLSSGLFADVKQYIDQHYVDVHYVARNASEDMWACRRSAIEHRPRQSEPYLPAAPAPIRSNEPDASRIRQDAADDGTPPELINMLRHLDEGFSPYLLHLIDRSGMKDSECYKRANIDRKLFSKIRSNPAYKPSKPTAVAFCVALELPLREAEELLSRAGYALSRANKFDVIVEYFIMRGKYDVHEINQVLLAYDMPLLGA